MDKYVKRIKEIYDQSSPESYLVAELMEEAAADPDVSDIELITLHMMWSIGEMRTANRAVAENVGTLYETDLRGYARGMNNLHHVVWSELVNLFESRNHA